MMNVSMKRFLHLVVLLTSMLTVAFAQSKPAQVCYTPKPAVPATVRSIVISSQEIPVIYVGDTVTFYPQVRMSNGVMTNDFSAASSDDSVLKATTDASGGADKGVHLTGVKAGKATLTVTPTKDSSKAKKYEVVVKNHPAPEGLIDPSDRDALAAAAQKAGVCGGGSSAISSGISPLLLLLLIPAAILGWILARRSGFTQADIDNSASRARGAEQDRQQALSNAANARADEAVREAVRHGVRNGVLEEQMRDFDARVKADVEKRTAELQTERDTAVARTTELETQLAAMQVEMENLRVALNSLQENLNAALGAHHTMTGIVKK